MPSRNSSQASNRIPSASTPAAQLSPDDVGTRRVPLSQKETPW
jgi:hypothetical protein